MKKYDKLIRDKIPEIIKADGKECEVEVMDEKEYKNYLQDKLVEEVEEYIESEEIEELADILEVMRAIAELEDVDFDEIDRIREAKKDERGGFEERLKLLQVFG
ncbi:MAG: phosphoribosyl-ATP pyrophosphohydrolase [Bacillota bacterium]